LPHASTRFELSGPWELLPVEEFTDHYPTDAAWHQQELPGHWQELTALEQHTGKMVYRKTFDWAPTLGGPTGKLFLRLSGVFYRYHLKLNGIAIGDGEGYFFPQEFDITEVLKPQNELVIEVDSPVERSKLDKETITGVFAHWDALSSYKYNPGGVWLPVEIVLHPDVHIKRALIQLESFDQETAHIGVRLDLKVAAKTQANWRVTFTPHNFEGEAREFQGEIALAEGEYGWQQAIALAPYKLWWTHDTGFPHLYKVEVVLEGAIDHPVHWEGITGLRTWSFENFIGRLNGQRLYLKGSNYPPGDARLGTMNRERAALDMRLAKDAHMNMLRIHAHVDHPAIYAEADAFGIVLWQDFPFQWLYARKILPQALRQCQEMVRLLYNHPSIVIWCMHNEPLYVVDTSKEPFFRRMRTYTSLFYTWNRDVMGKQTTRAVENLDKHRTVIRASGELWVPGLLDGTDGHYYFGWYMSYGPKRWFDFWRKVFKRNLRFVTEFGAQSFPNYDNSRKFLPDDLRGSDWKFLLDHYLLQWDLMNLWIDTRSMDLADLVRRTQAYQSEINRYYVDRLRFYKYKPNGGFLNFMYMDSQPCVSWSIIDYWREPKASYYAYKQALSPQYVFSLTPTDHYKSGKRYQLPIYVVNDEHKPKPVQILVRLLDPDGQTLYEQGHALTLGPDCEAHPMGAVTFCPKRAGQYKLVLALSQEGTAALENIYELEVA
jgi:beta-mannosidase